MYTSEALLDLHTRGHWTLRRLLEHCGAFSPEELARELSGFGYPNLRQQFAHVIGAERYWIGVLQGRMDADDRDDPYPTTVALEQWRAEVAATTDAYLRTASAGELNTPRKLSMWGGREGVLMPARVFVRTLTHIYQHQGQMVAQCRLLGRPASGLDFPIA